MSQRSRFLALVLEQMGQPYGWGKKGGQFGDSAQVDQHGFIWRQKVRQFDCSGLVTWAYGQAAGLSADADRHWRMGVNTDGLLKRCAKTTNPAPGTLCLYGPSTTDMDHVMVYLMPGLVVGACGGGSKTLTVADALRDNARVQTRPGHDYRKVNPFRFFVELPFADEQGGPHS